VRAHQRAGTASVRENLDHLFQMLGERLYQDSASIALARGSIIERHPDAIALPEWDDAVGYLRYRRVRVETTRGAL